MKTVVLIAPHFFPSFLPSVHRARLWAYHLPEFGWRPIIVTTHSRYYECQIDEELMALVPPEIEVVRTRALPTKPVRLIGNLGFRSVYWYYKAVRDIARRVKVDFVHITCDSFPASLAGRPIQRLLNIPYGIDYQDPWLPETPTRHRPMSKAWLAQRVSAFLEPIALRKARLITGINEAYFNSALKRNPEVAKFAVTAGMPFGSSERDFEFLKSHPRKLYLFDPADGNFHMFYAGALLPKAVVILDRFFEALALLRDRGELPVKLRIHFVGTGLSEADPTRGHMVKPYIGKWNLGGVISEMPSRIKYLDVLTHLAASNALLIIGSTETHYSPSKVFQCVLSRRPVFVLLHEACSALQAFRGSNAGPAFTFTERELPDPQRLAVAFSEFLGKFEYDAAKVNWDAFNGESARESTRLFAAALDRAVARRPESA